MSAEPQRERAVVIGSGFGGGVSALRLARAGVPTLVLERGLRWLTGPNATTFPTLVDFDRRAAWLADHSNVSAGMPKTTWKPFTGLIETIEGTGMTGHCGAAVGGGSLMYHGMTLQPTEEYFAQSMPMAGGGRLRRARPGALPDCREDADDRDGPRRRPPRLALPVFAPVPRCRTEGAGWRRARVPLPVDWNFVRAELNGQFEAGVHQQRHRVRRGNNGVSSLSTSPISPPRRRRDMCGSRSCTS